MRQESPTVSRRRLLGALAATGGAAALAPLVASPAEAAHAGGALQGVVQSGPGRSARRLRAVRVSVLGIGDAAATPVGSGRTDGRGRFHLRLAPTEARYLQVVADTGGGAVLSAVVPSDHRGRLVVNELTTVAVGYAFAQQLPGGTVRGTRLGLQAAAGMQGNLVDAATGAVSDVLLASPNADQTTSLRTLRALGNLVCGFVRSRGRGLDALLALLAHDGDEAPEDLLQAVAAIARHPERHVAAIDELSQAERVFRPSLQRTPDAWTIAVKVNDTGRSDLLFGGPANIAWDDRGYAWITNNVFQGTPTSSTFNVVLRPDGRPSDGTHGTPLSPLVGGGILGAGFGVAADPDGSVWMSNFGWGGTDYQPSASTTGSLSRFAPDGTPLSGATGIQGGPVRAQGIAVDRWGNAWVASYGNDRLYVLPGGDPTASVFFQLPDGACPFDVHLAEDGTAWLTCSGGLQSSADSRIGRYEYVAGEVREIWSIAFGHSLKGMALDSLGNAWIASGGDDCVYLVDASGDVVGSYDGGGVDTPWSVEVDGDDHVWVANFGPERINSDFRTSSISRLVGANPATRPAGAHVGDPISPPTGYTLPSAGEEVLLADGTPLYGEGRPPSFAPLQRLTAVRVDAAGNAWAINNWKPSFDADLVDPGGDGIAIFVGIAPPVVR